MFRWLFILISVMVGLAACASGGPPVGDTSLNSAPPSSGPAEAATKAWQEAYDSRDPARITALYAPEAVLWGTRAKRIAADPPGILAYFKDSPTRPTARVEFGEQYLRVYGDIAVSTGYYTFSEVRDGQRVARPARYSMTFKLRDGVWRILSHHSSEVP